MSTVFDTLSASRAECLAHHPLGHGRALALWRNRRDRVAYDAPQGHTVSLYLHGGTRSRRIDRGGVAGYPGAVCVMPEGERSDWEIGGAFSFAHLYLPDAELRRFYALSHDRAPGRLSLAGQTFAREPALAAAMRALIAAPDPLAREQALVQVQGALCAHAAPAPQRGGLSPAVSRRVCAALHDQMGSPPGLAELAALAGLSPWHFQRSFRASHGVTPHGWLERARIARACALIARGTALAEVAAACGYSSQSHLTRAFARGTAMTPARYRAAIAR